MKRYVGFITAVLVTSLIVSDALAANRGSNGSSTRSVVESLEFRQLAFIRSIDADGELYADKLSYMFVYLHRRGGTFSTNPRIAISESSRTRFQLSKGLLTDSKLRASVKEWMNLTYSTITSDFDSLGTVESAVLSRDAFSTALLTSPRFWDRLTEISRTENFDFRLPIRREIRALQYAGNGVAWIAGGGVASLVFRALNLTRLALVVASVPAVAISTIAIWDFAQAEDELPKTTQGLKATAQRVSLDTQNEIRILHEHQRRLVVLNNERDVRSVLSQMSLARLKESRPELAIELAKLKPQLAGYREKLDRDQLPIKIATDVPEIRADVARAVDFLIQIAGELEKI